MLYRALSLLPYLLAFFMMSCASDYLAPVVESSWMGASTAASIYVVKQGDTLYSIAFRYDLDYRQLAAFNRLDAPYRLQVGQRLHMRIKPKKRSARPIFAVKKPQTAIEWVGKASQVNKVGQNKAIMMPAARPLALTQNTWSWPVQGRVASLFSPQNGKKGINIAGKKGNKICAAKKGIVAYAGSGLNGYGNLIIIKHDDHFLTAYGNNASNFVHEGQSVRAGQEIAQMGMIGSAYWGLHFEVRQNGQPINPLHVLPR